MIGSGVCSCCLWLAILCWVRWLWYSLLFEFVFNDALAGLLCGGGLVCFLVSVGGLILCSFICGLVCYCDLLLVF